MRLGQRRRIGRFNKFFARKFGGIDIQFNNCGGPPRSLPSEAEEGIWREWFEIIVLAAIKATKAALPRLRTAGWGRILPMTSSNIFMAATANVLSTSLRLALVGWSKALENEVAQDGITVNCLVPGLVETERVREGDISCARRSGVTPEEIKKRVIA